MNKNNFNIRTTDVFKFLPGILLVFVIGLLSKLTANYIAIGSVAIAIIIGIIIGNLFKIPTSFKNGTKLAEKKFLSVAIALLGVQLNVSVLSNLGYESILFIIIVSSTSITISYFVGRLFKLSKPFSLLLGIGNAICGSSAIAGASPILNANEEETGISISVVNFLGTIGIFLIPALTGYLLQFDSVQNGLMIGGTLQAVGHVTAAGFGMSDEIGNIATVVKMGRILLLGPVLIILALMFKSNGSSIKKSKPIPGFIIGFTVLIILTNLNLIPTEIISILKTTSKELLIMAMAAIGLNISFKSIITQGPKALFTGTIIFLIQIVMGLILLVGVLQF